VEAVCAADRPAEHLGVLLFVGAPSWGWSYVGLGWLIVLARDPDLLLPGLERSPPGPCPP
jgi:hypothetical protein